MNVAARDRAVKTSAWLLYTLIVLEILFMVSPFAAYYYSIYATPLNALQESQHTAWLTMYLLPHFTYSDSWLANGLILISWPLILLGIVLFVFGFVVRVWFLSDLLVKVHSQGGGRSGSLSIYSPPSVRCTGGDRARHVAILVPVHCSYRFRKHAVYLLLSRAGRGADLFG